MEAGYAVYFVLFSFNLFHRGPFLDGCRNDGTATFGD